VIQVSCLASIESHLAILIWMVMPILNAYRSRSDAKGVKMTRDLEDTAYHEAGHAVAAVAFRRPFHYVTIEPCEESLGHVMLVQDLVQSRT
jgi:hypothetical protein